MKIGIDIRVLQNDHQFRGIGEVARQTINRMLPMGAGDGVEFVFYRHDDDMSVTTLLDIPKDLTYSEVRVDKDPLKHQRTKQQKLHDGLREMYGNPLVEATQCDVFLQYDYTLGVPNRPKTVLVKHDIIPYIFWDKYFSSPLVHIKHRAARTTLRTIYHNHKYVHVLRRALRQAASILCVSDYTRQDLHRHFGVALAKMKTVHLGISQKPITGHVEKAKLPAKPYLLFVGAVDANRRSIQDLFAAYNSLKAAGHDIQLVLAGENFSSPEYITKILPAHISKVILGSSYNKDVLRLGYVNDATKKHLYEHAIAFVFPTQYEGFGIPVLEAMNNNCPVITYKNSSIPEVGGDAALYASGWEDILRLTKKLLVMKPAERAELVAKAHAHAGTFSWDVTAQKMYEELQRVAGR